MTTETISKIFNLPHVFVVFHPGASGNFISNLVRNIVDNNLTSLPLLPSGSCHYIAEDVKYKAEYFSCGMFFAQHLLAIKPYSFDKRVEFYRNKMSSYDRPINSPVVTWTHDFTNIPVYRKLFPNSKILVITQDSLREKLITIIMRQLKTILSDSPTHFLSSTIKDWYTELWKKECTEVLESLLGTNNSSMIAEMLNDRFNIKYKNMLLYASIQRTLTEYNLLEFNDNVKDTVNWVSYHKSNQRVIVKPYHDYIDDECILLPLRHIADNNFIEINKSLAMLLDTLTPNHIEYVKYSLNQYTEVQPAGVNIDPEQFIKTLAHSVNIEAIEYRNGNKA